MAWRGGGFFFLSRVREQQQQQQQQEIVFRFDTRAARFGAAVPPQYLSTRMRALDVRV
jgi:hypothetical protein